MIDRCHLDQFVVAGTLVADDAVDIDDVAAMHPDKMTAVQPRFDVADGERAEQLVVAVEDGGVVRVGMHRDDLLNGQEMRAAIALDRQVTGKAPGRRTGATERRITAAAEFDALAGRGRSGNRYRNICNRVRHGCSLGDRNRLRLRARRIGQEEQKKYAGNTEPNDRARNLSFGTDINELNFLIEYNLLDLRDHKVTPYVFAVSARTYASR